MHDRLAFGGDVMRFARMLAAGHTRWTSLPGETKRII
jgi:hypothetical protein